MKTRRTSIGTIILKIVSIGSIVAVIALMTIAVIKGERGEIPERHYSFDDVKTSIEYKFK